MAKRKPQAPAIADVLSMEQPLITREQPNETTAKVTNDTQVVVVVKKKVVKKKNTDNL